MNPFVYYGYVQPQFSYPVSPYDRHGTVQHKEALAVPDNLLYTTAVEPQFTEQFVRHIGLMIVITTTVGKLVGTLEEVCMDHVTLAVHGKKHHIRLREIVYFEIAEEK